MNNTINNELKHQEAIKRMKLLNIDPTVIQDFDANKTIYMSIKGFNVPIFDVLVNELIAKTRLANPYVYYLIQDEAGMISMLFISNDIDDWETETQFISDGVVYPYVLNFSEPNYSEIGSIVVVNVNGALVRVS